MLSTCSCAWGWVITEHPCFISGLLGAPPAMPLLTGPALSTALLQLALQSQSQSQKVTASCWGAAPPGSFSSLPLMSEVTFPSALEKYLGLVARACISIPEVSMTKKAQP